MNKPLLVMLLLLTLPVTAAATKLYKWIDKDGKVTYQETPPPSGSGKVEEKNIDPDQNVIKADHPPPTPTLSSAPNAGTFGRAVPNTSAPPTRPPMGALLNNGAGAEVSPPPPTPPLPPAPLPPPAGIR